jgi:hypothetical protein
MVFSVSAGEEGLSRFFADALIQLIAGTSASLPTLNMIRCAKRSSGFGSTQASIE